MTKWEYEIESWMPNVGQAEGFLIFLNERGELGWQLVSKDKFAGVITCVFKRPRSIDSTKCEWLDRPDSRGLWWFSQRSPDHYYDGLPFEVLFVGVSNPEMMGRDLCSRGEYRPISAFIGKWKKMPDENPGDAN